MTDRIFTTGNRVPPFVHDIVTERNVEAMQHGEITWISAGAIRVDEDGVVYVSTRMGKRRESHGGPRNVKLVMDFDSFYVDATALSRSDLEEHFKGRASNNPASIGTEDLKPVAGVIFPIIRDVTGLDAEAAAEFNEAQLVARREFGEYFKAVFGRDYTFADSQASNDPSKDKSKAKNKGFKGRRLGKKD